MFIISTKEASLLIKMATHYISSLRLLVQKRKEVNYKYSIYELNI